MANAAGKEEEAPDIREDAMVEFGGSDVFEVQSVDE